MSNIDIVRAWKDAEYRQHLSAEELARLPEHPAGAIDLTDEELDQAIGGTGTLLVTLLCDFCTNLIVCHLTTLTA